MYKFYLYRHIRLDKNVPFYIGIGTAQPIGKFRSIYARAFAIRGRNPFWKHIAAKTAYDVEIVYECNCENEIKAKEIEFIALYKSTLCNITNGGDNCAPIFHKKVYQYTLSGKFVKEHISANTAARELRLSTSSMNRCLMGLRKSNNLGGFQWFYTYQGQNIPATIVGKVTTHKKVRLYNQQEEHIFNSREECAKFINRSPSRVTDLIKQGYFQNYKIENHG